MATLSVQLYTLRDQLTSDRDATLAALATMGFDFEVREPAELRDRVRMLADRFGRAGLPAPLLK